MQLNDEQVKNWRNVLGLTLGPYAFVMSREDVEKMADVFQEKINKMPKGPEKEEAKKLEVKPVHKEPPFNTPFAKLLK